jgi:hypothetical protein
MSADKQNAAMDEDENIGEVCKPEISESEQ